MDDNAATRAACRKEFSDFGIRRGVRLSAEYRDSGLYPKSFSGEVDNIYENFALIHTKKGYYTTIHISDLICGFVYVRLLDIVQYGQFDTARAAANQ